MTGGVADYLNSFSYDAAGRLASITQEDQDAASSYHAVSEKRVDFGYNRAGQFSRIARYSDVAGMSPVANTSYAYDTTGRLRELAHYQGEDTGGTLLAGYAYEYDAANRLEEIDFLPSAYDDEDVTYTYDDRGQIDTVDYAGTSDVEEDYNFDANGNRVGNQVIDSATETYESTAGSNNQLLDDGTFTYTYDGEGNRTSRTRISTAAADDFITEYEWDHRNRLTKVTLKNNSSQITETVEYRYDFANRLIGRTHDTTPTVANDEHETIYVHDSGQFSQPHAEITLSHKNTQAVLQFEGTGPNDLDADDLANRYLWGPLFDQLLADEQIDWSNSQADGDTLWALTDHLGTVRDLVDDTGVVQNHKSYDAFGNVTAETNAAIDTVFAYTGKLFDDATGLQNNINRWYDASIGKWISEDPIGFVAGDANLGL